MLQLQQLKKTYDKREILNIPSVELGKGIYWIKGINGSGKTTLLKMISGLIPFSGDIVYDGVSLKKQPLSYRRQVSWAMAEPVFPEFISGADLIALYCSIRNVPQKEADELVSVFKMDDYIKTATGTYSSGMLKKLTIVLALLGKPPLIVLDEPLITLDTETVVLVCELIEEWNQHFGISFLLSSHHDVEEFFEGKYRELTVANQTLQFTT